MAKEIKHVSKICLTDVKTGQFAEIDGKLYVVIKNTKYTYSIIPIKIKEAKHYNIEASDFNDLNIETVYDAKTGKRLMMNDKKDDEDATN